MKHTVRKFLVGSGVVFLSVSGFMTPVQADDSIPMWRLYNPNSGEHFYTASVNEREHLVDAGWRMEGVGWTAPAQGDDVYRLYNKNGGEHHYTTDAKERDALVAKGWKDEGVGWKSGGDIVLKREYNPHAFSCNHNYTTSDKEHDHLVKIGWRDEGTAWKAVGEGYKVNYNENAYYRKGFPALSSCATDLGRMNSDINDSVTNNEVDEQTRDFVNQYRDQEEDVSEMDEFSRAARISDYVLNKFPYSLSSVKGVREMIESGTGDCWPHSELILFMMRKTGISQCWFVSPSVSSHHEVIANLNNGSGNAWYEFNEMGYGPISEADANRLLGR